MDRMRFKRWMIGLGVAGAFVGLVAYRVHAKRAAFADAPLPPVQAVAVATVHSGTLTEGLLMNGTVIFPTEVKISSKATGVMRQLYVDEGKSVHKGDMIAEVD